MPLPVRCGRATLESLYLKWDVAKDHEVPLSDEETRCIDLACHYLAAKLGGTWGVESNLDHLFPTDPSPEVIVTNGRGTAAIEVKRLTGDSIYQAYLESLLSNQRFLMPSCGGYSSLNPPVDFRLPMDVSLRRHVKKEIERVAPTLDPGKSGVVLVARQGHISLTSESGPPHVMCYHYGPYSELLRPLMERVAGKFMLVDDKGFQHSFFTDEGRAAFHDAVVDAFEKRVKGVASPFTWYEEWKLTRLEDAGEDTRGDRDGVWIIAVTEARDMRESVAECVYTVLDNALRKFAWKRWADHHVVVLEGSIAAPQPLVSEVVAALEPDELRDIDLILLVDGHELIQCHPARP